MATGILTESKTLRIVNLMSDETISKETILKEAMVGDLLDNGKA